MWLQRLEWVEYGEYGDLICAVPDSVYLRGTTIPWGYMGAPKAHGPPFRVKVIAMETHISVASYARSLATHFMQSALGLPGDRDRWTYGSLWSLGIVPIRSLRSSHVRELHEEILTLARL